VHRLAASPDAEVVVLDRLTYAGNLDNLAALDGKPRYHFQHGDICDRDLVHATLQRFRPRIIFNLAAESHVDRSIDGPREFVRTNVLGTFELLDAARQHWATLDPLARSAFRFVHVSTDEVYGSLGETGFFTERTPYAPNSPYAASKAGADHLGRAYFHTFGLPVVTTNCSNNYGPYQFPEKLIPLCTLNALEGKPLPVYGDGKNVRDWLFVGDHCQALLDAAAHGTPGETYALGGRNEQSTLDIVHKICDLLDELSPPTSNPAHAAAGRSLGSYRELITFVKDRPGHDRRYAIDPAKAERELAWRPTTDFDRAMRATIGWYLANRAWCDRIASGSYRRERLGLGGTTR
jgi:dTDP-glucose 4,6-dehydratase